MSSPENRSPSAADVTLDLQMQRPGTMDRPAKAAEPSSSRYRWIESLATGGMGEVRRARDADLERDVAVKLLRPDVPQFEMRQRFEEEGRLMGGLEHPNIPPVHGTGVTPEGQPFYVMRLLEGDTLEEIIERLVAGDTETHAAFPLHRRLQIIQQLISVLDFAHRQGILHRDIKPANIMLGEHGEVFVLDWGIALRMDSQGRADDGAELAGSIIGTPAYMSPEQAVGMIGALGPASDVFSLCTVCYEFLALRHPLGESRGNGLDAVRAALSKPVPLEASERPPRHQDAVPREVALIFHRGLEREIARRPATMDALAADLARVLDGRNRVLCGQTGLKRAVFSFGRFVDGHHRAATWLVLAVGLLATLGLVTLILLATTF